MKLVESLVRQVAEAHPESVARALETSEARESAAFLEGLPIAAAARVVDRLMPARGAGFFAEISTPRAAAILSELPLQSVARLFQVMEPARRDELAAALPEGVARDVRSLAVHAAETAGGMMDPRVASLTIDLTAQQSIAAIRRMPPSMIYYLYVTDRDGRLAGVLNMRDLLLADPRAPIEPLIRREVVSVPASMDREEMAALMSERRFLAMPVVDGDRRLLGVVKVEKALDTMRDEAFEDLQLMTGAGGDERALSPVSSVVRRRLPWLALNLGTAFLAAAVVGAFESVIAAATALAVLMPVVSAIGGNTGAQALAVVIRGLAVREVVPGLRRRLVMKEAGGALVNGLFLGLFGAGVVFAWYRSPGLAAVIGMAMVVSMVSAGVFGAAIPLVLKALGRDPAQASSIFLTTLTDVVGFGSFLGLAAAFSRAL